MDRFPRLSLLLSIVALIALSTAHVGIARAEPGGISPGHQGSICEATPNTARDGTHQARLADIRTQIEAAGTEDDVIPLNGSGYNYQAKTTPSSELLFMDAELQGQ